MASFREVLKRLFSRNVIITKTKSGKLRTLDFNKSQSSGSPTTYSNRPRWKNGRNYGTTSGYGGGFTNEEIEALRKQMYQDYDIMDTDAIVSSVLEICADECTTVSETGELLVIKTNDARIKKVLHNLFYDVMNIEFNLWSWVRTACKYGDNFLYLQVAEGVGIVNVMPIHPALMIREEGSRDDPEATRFRYEGDYGMTWGSNNYFEEYEIAHFRLLSDVNFLPYGKSIIEGGKQEFKRMRLAEDAMLLNRIMRAPERRLFKIDIGNIAPEEVDAYIEEISNMMKKTPYIDPQTGELNLRYNILNSLEDYFLPVRGSDSGTSIDTLPGLTNDGMLEDVEYFKNKMIAAFKVPKEYIGYTEEGSTDKCIHPDTKIPLLDGRVLTVKEISEIYTDETNLWVYSFDFATNQVIPAKIKYAKKTRLDAELVRVHLDNDEFIDCTPDHGFLLKDGTRKSAIELSENDSLCAVYRRKIGQQTGGNGNPYEQIYQPNLQKWKWTHSIVDEYFNGKIEKNGYDEFGKFDQNSIIIRHHADFNRFNNNPDNLIRMTRIDHCKVHSENMEKTIHSPESFRKAAETNRLPENRLKRSIKRKQFLNDNPIYKSILKDSWLSRTHEERSLIVKSGITDERLQQFSEVSKRIGFHQYGQAALKLKYPDGRTDLHGSNSVRWVDRPTIDFVLNFIELHPELYNSGIKFSEFSRMMGYDYRIVRDTIHQYGFTVNQFLNQFLGYADGRPKDLKGEYVLEIAHNHKNIDELCVALNMTKKTLLKQLNNSNISIDEFNNNLGKCYNHKVTFVELLTERSDTYNLEIDDVNHNYLTEAGVVIKNSSLSQKDIRFARTIERIQKIFVSELYKIALIHLKVQGFEAEDFLNFELTLTNPSLIFERQKTDVLTAKIDLAKSAREENPLLSDYYIYKNIFGFTDDEIKQEELYKLEALKFRFRATQLTEEGNDPEVTGKSFGTAHDIATMQVASKYMPGQYGEMNKQLYTPDGREENQGKPDQYKGSFETVRDKDFGRDPLGRRENSKVENFQRIVKKLDKFKVKPKEGLTMLNEENLLNDEDNYN